MHYMLLQLYLSGNANNWNTMFSSNQHKEYI